MLPNVYPSSRCDVGLQQAFFKPRHPHAAVQMATTQKTRETSMKIHSPQARSALTAFCLRDMARYDPSDACQAERPHNNINTMANLLLTPRAQQRLLLLSASEEVFDSDEILDILNDGKRLLGAKSRMGLSLLEARARQGEGGWVPSSDDVLDALNGDFDFEEDSDEEEEDEEEEEDSDPEETFVWEVEDSELEDSEENDEFDDLGGKTKDSWRVFDWDA
ncbi:hypothetical protein FB45DRAFT_1024825 [Roridomyces roridus]|uniref:Uncharacterized protein n=1 Tax=Roridomyces roridus TaxID=1738132 RepID=A0AAD7C1H4_9AGAR|nr:hypothetical protein FB45DRAFT_1024825 [Roridomyces roridus]